MEYNDTVGHARTFRINDKLWGRFKKRCKELGLKLQEQVSIAFSEKLEKWEKEDGKEINS
ncbi:MAG: hypothetical protein PHP92_04210 [Candidatus Nanoarchaeia archaeon]|nr:hypothetical protein [Candidatus Nanoarchaeia archaeon]